MLTQRVAIELLQHVYDDLMTCETAGVESQAGVVDTGEQVDTWSLWRAITGKTEPAQAKDVNGLYLYGGVGCGKTMLMDIFYESVPPNIRKQRVCRDAKKTCMEFNIYYVILFFYHVACDRMMMAPGSIQSVTHDSPRQIHYHDFMLDVHQRLRHLQNTQDPLQALAEVRCLLKH